ncbi:MAG: 50S ribosomal protein L23 [Alphaproteobacteria bacterium]|nr:50S ribosomal protein L23 [Alphaproteobacteria bacterium]OJV16384.1 MAG: 50S ribosomal protein L23 [Alphaproteobacteria bacterium 33-17]
MVSLNIYDVLVKPIVTEKTDSMTAFNKFTFEVAGIATKHDVKKAVESIFGVSVKEVNTITNKGKTKRFRGRLGRRSDVKKAIVTLKDGQAIDFSGEIK